MPEQDSALSPFANGGVRSDFKQLDLYRLLVQTVRDYAIFVLDPTGKVLTWNPGAQNLKGYTADEIVGKHFSTFYLPEAVESGWPQRELTLAVKEGRFADEGWRVKKDGGTFWASVTHHGSALSEQRSCRVCKGNPRPDRPTADGRAGAKLKP